MKNIYPRILPVVPCKTLKSQLSVVLLSLNDDLGQATNKYSIMDGIFLVTDYYSGITMFTEESPRGEGYLLGSAFAGYIPLASQSPHPIIVYSVANYRPHLSHFFANAIPT